MALAHFAVVMGELRSHNQLGVTDRWRIICDFWHNASIGALHLVARSMDKIWW